MSVVTWNGCGDVECIVEKFAHVACLVFGR
jgi:hypothetical protein